MERERSKFTQLEWGITPFRLATSTAVRNQKLVDGERNVEGGAVAGFAVYIDRTTQPVDKVTRPKETKSHAAALFGAPAHVENMGQILGANADAAVANDNLQAVRRLQAARQMQFARFTLAQYSLIAILQDHPKRFA